MANLKHPFKVKRRYRHPSTFDIDLEVLTILGQSERYVSMIVRYWNRHYRIYQGRPQAVSVRTEHFPQWKEVALIATDVVKA